MTDPARFAQLRFASAAKGRGVWAPLAWLGGLIAAAFAVAVGTVLAVFATLAVAVIAVVGSVLVFFAGIAMRARRSRRPNPVSPDGVIDAEKVGDTWVAYGWERRSGR